MTNYNTNAWYPPILAESKVSNHILVSTSIAVHRHTDRPPVKLLPQDYIKKVG